MSLLIVKKNIQLTYLFLRKFPIYTDICVYIYMQRLLYTYMSIEKYVQDFWQEGNRIEEEIG